MNTAVKAITSRGLSLWTLPISWSKAHLVIFIMALAVIASAFSLVYVRDMNRQLTSQVAQAQFENGTLHNQWTQLLQKKSALASQANVAVLAKKDFGMKLPKPRSVKMLTNA
jgi:cell division protein FtsL